MEATHIELSHETSEDDPVFAPADRVVVHLADGSAIDSGEVAYARGHARLPVSAVEVRRKFTDCARHGGCADADGLFDLLGGLGGIADLRSLPTRTAPLVTRTYCPISTREPSETLLLLHSRPTPRTVSPAQWTSAVTLFGWPLKTWSLESYQTDKLL
jgi:hypothetical protein